MPWSVLVLVFTTAAGHAEPSSRAVAAPRPAVSAQQAMPARDSDPAGRDVLSVSIGIETAGGVNSIMIPRGARLPATRTEVFSTATDDQSRVEIHVVAGELPLVRDNRSLGRVQLDGIPPARRAVPQIEVRFQVGTDGVVTAAARDLGTGAQRSYSFGSVYTAGADHAAGATVDVKLFTPDIPFDAMPVTLALQLAGGRSVPLVPRGAQLPAQITETFSTSEDKQRSLGLHLALGERRTAPGNVDTHDLSITGIPPAPRGQQQVVVTFVVDAGGTLHVDANDRATGASRPITIEGPQPAPLDEQAIERLLAQLHVAADPVRALERWRQALDATARQIRALLASAGPRLPEDVRESCERAVARAEQRRGASDVTVLRAAIAELRTAAHAATDALYRAVRRGSSP